MYCYFKDKSATKLYIIGQSWVRNGDSANKWLTDNCINVYVAYKLLVGNSKFSESNKLTDEKYDLYMKLWKKKNVKQKMKTFKKAHGLFTENFDQTQLAKLNIKWNDLQVEIGMYF